MIRNLIFLFAVVLLAACEPMDANYQEYLKNIAQYSPRVTNLKAEVPEIGTVVLTWTNPMGDTAVKIRIDIGDMIYNTNELVDTYRLENLDVKGYNISVYTVDRYGNLSVPTSVPAFPKPEE